MYQKAIAKGSAGILSDLNINNILIYTDSYVEIGGVKIATRNLGAVEDFDYGLYFLWGDTLGYTIDLVGSGEGKKYFSINDYKFSDGSGLVHRDHYTKYTGKDGKLILDPEDDAAHVLWGGKWRMPTNAEIVQIALNSQFESVTNYKGTGINGIILKDKKDLSKRVFFPAGGCLTNGAISKKTHIRGYYWTSSLNTGTDAIVGCYYYNYAIDGSSMCNVKTYRQTGLMIRPVLGE